MFTTITTALAALTVSVAPAVVEPIDWQTDYTTGDFLIVMLDYAEQMSLMPMLQEEASAALQDGDLDRAATATHIVAASYMHIADQLETHPETRGTAAGTFVLATMRACAAAYQLGGDAIEDFDPALIDVSTELVGACSTSLDAATALIGG